MRVARHEPISVARIWELARSGDLRGATDAARRGLAQAGGNPRRGVELRLAIASCAMRQGLHPDALCELDAASRTAAGAGAVMHVEAWRAELAYFQGRYSAAEDAIGKLLPQLVARRDWAYAAFESWNVHRLVR